MDLIDIDRAASVPVVVPRVKRLDASVAPAFKQAVVQLVQSGEKRLVLDLGGVEFLDSSGLGALVSILKALGAQGTLAVCGARGPVLSLFQLTRMDKVFTIDADRTAALARVGA